MKTENDFSGVVRGAERNRALHRRPKSDIPRETHRPTIPIDPLSLCSLPRETEAVAVHREQKV